MAETLDPHTLRERLGDLPGWSVLDGRLHREYVFADFALAFGFVCRTLLLAERHGHHPDLANSYTRVTVDLISHDVGAITSRDLTLAAAIDAATSEVSTAP